MPKTYSETIPDEFETVGFYESSKQCYWCLSCAARRSVLEGGSHLRYWPIKENDQPYYTLYCNHCNDVVLKGTVHAAPRTERKHTHA